MNRRDLTINLVLLAAIAAVTYLIFAQSSQVTSLPAPKAYRKTQAPPRETDFNPDAVGKIYTNVGETRLFQAIITPTPTPTPTPAPPEKTPDIHNALRAWRLMTAGDGAATIEDKSAKEGEEGRVFELKIGESHQMQGEGGSRSVTLKSIDESGDFPAAVFTMEGTSEEAKLKMEQ